MNFLCPSLSISVKHGRSRAQVSTYDSHRENITLRIVEQKTKRFSEKENLL